MARRRWIIDAMNVIGSRPDGWWRDRNGAVVRLVTEVSAWRSRCGEPVLVVVDGHPIPALPEGTHAGVHVRYAHSTARDAADESIEAVVAGHAEPTSLVVVTSDRALARHCRDLGAEITGAGAFLVLLRD